MMNKKYVYWNKKQENFLKGFQSRKFFMGGRGVGKTTTDAGEWQKRSAYLPRSKSFLLSATYNQILTKTLPAIESKLKEMGWKEDIHYVMGKRPPAHFQSCVSEPKKYENVFSVVNGFRVEMISMDNPQTARGGSYQSGSVDEALNLKESDYSSIIVPSVRPVGTDKFFEGKPCYKQVCFYTSLPRKATAEWLYKYEQFAQYDPDNFLFVESTSWDNVDILGEDTLRMWEKEMPYLEYQIEVMNRRLRVVKSAYCYNFSRDRNTYSVQYLYDIGERGYETKHVVDVNYQSDELLEVTIDIGGWHNTFVVIQERHQKAYVIDHIAIDDEEGKLDELITAFLARYNTSHKHKVVRLWGERMAAAKNPLLPTNIFDYIALKLRAKGWVVQVKAKIDNTIDHKARRVFINDVFAGKHSYLPMVLLNETQAADLIIGLENAATKEDGSLDKSKEKDRNFPQKWTTHAPDALFYYFIQRHGGKVALSGSHRKASVHTA